MGRLRSLVCTCVLFAVIGGTAAAAEPPNQNDPCSRAGRDSCGTTGKGSYRDYRYGVRWFGDYRSAVPGVSDPTFCIDLRFWYPSRSYRYERRGAEGLRNRDGDTVSTTSLRRMSYAIWQFGRSDQASRQAAVMLYVHRLMGDAAPGEAAPGALSSASRSILRRIQRDAARYAGPYRVVVDLPDRLVDGVAAEATVEVVSSSTGRKVPGIDVEVAAKGATGAPARVTTGGGGSARLAFTPDDPSGGVDLTLRAVELPAELPRIYAPSKGKAARNGQRLAAPASTSERARVRAPVKLSPQIGTQVSSQSVAPGSAITDTVRVSGLSGKSITVGAALYGPYPAPDAITCAGTPVWTGSFTATADGSYTTAPVTLSTPGYYTYRESVAETPVTAAVTTPCGEAAETTVVRGAPAITTRVSAQQAAPGAKITDTAVVTGLGALRATVNVALFGPFPTRAAIACTGTPFWTGTLTAAGDGSYVTAPATLTRAGYYTYRESIAAADAYPGVTTACGDAAETTFAKAAPKVVTKVSDAALRPGSKLHDRLRVTGLGETPARVALELFGPYSTRAAIDCGGRPFWTGSVTVDGDGSYSSPSVTIRRVGFYVYRERIAGSETVTGTSGECAVESETSLGRPLIVTGRGDPDVALVRASGAPGTAKPTRVRMGSLGIDARITGVGIDRSKGALGIPKAIDRVGWWADGAAPGDAHGAILLAGHVDSATRGAGAFFALKDGARRGDRVKLDSNDGRTRRYRVTSVRRMRKEALPAGIFSRTGERRLVLVTCGGPFDARLGHYRDNIVVTARPL